MEFWRRLGALGLLAMLGAASAAERAAPVVPSSACDLSVPAADVAAARASLLQTIPPPDDPDLPPTDVAPGTKLALARYKVAIAALVSARFECAPPEQEPEALAAALNSAAAPAAACVDACRREPYAGAPQFAATRIDDTRHLIALTVRVPIPCGSDDALFLYRQDGAHWRERLRWQAAPYDSIGDAFENLQYRIAPPDARGEWYVAVRSAPAWCSSMWHSVRYAVLRPAADAARPRVIFRADDPIYGVDQEEPFRADADAFELRFRSNSIDGGVLVRPWVRRFAVDGDEVKRIPPLAETARDFVDEWIVSRWRAIAPWTSDDPQAALEHWHARVRGSDTHPYAEFKSAHACDGRSDAVEVEIERDSSDVDQDGVIYFLRVEGTPQDFRMVCVGTESDPGCGGEDLLPPLPMP